MATYVRPAGHYKQIIVRNERRATRLAETNDGSSPDYDFSEDHGSCSRNFYVKWSSNGQPFDPTNIAQIKKDILGDLSIKVKQSRRYISRTIPMEHPDFADTLFASNIRFMGTKGEPTRFDSVGIQSFDEALINVGYSQLSYNILTDDELTSTGGTSFPDEGTLLRNVTIDQQVGARYQTVPQFAVLRWSQRPNSDTDGGPVPGRALVHKNTIILYEGDLVITWHEVPLDAYPISAITALVGKTNSQPFGHPLSVARTYPADTLVAGPPKRKLRRMRNGQLGYDITYSFKYYPQGANNFFFLEEGRKSGYYPASTDAENRNLIFPRDGLGEGADRRTNPLGFTFPELFRPEPFA